MSRDLQETNPKLTGDELADMVDAEFHGCTRPASDDLVRKMVAEVVRFDGDVWVHEDQGYQVILRTHRGYVLTVHNLDTSSYSALLDSVWDVPYSAGVHEQHDGCITCNMTGQVTGALMWGPDECPDCEGHGFRVSKNAKAEAEVNQDRITEGDFSTAQIEAEAEPSTSTLEFKVGDSVMVRGSRYEIIEVDTADSVWPYKLWGFGWISEKWIDRRMLVAKRKAEPKPAADPWALPEGWQWETIGGGYFAVPEDISEAGYVSKTHASYSATSKLGEEVANEVAKLVAKRNAEDPPK